MKKLILTFILFLSLFGCNDNKVSENKKINDINDTDKMSEYKPIEPTGIIENSKETTLNKSPEQWDLIVKVNNDGTLSHVKNSIVWGKSSFDDINLDLHYKSSVRPTSLFIGRDHPNGIKIHAEFTKYRISLPVKFTDLGLNDSGELLDSFYIQAAEYDFDNDNIPEIIIAIGDGLINLDVNIFKYHAPQEIVDESRTENWELVAAVTGQSILKLENQSIILPFGSVGLASEYTWVKNKFVQTDDLNQVPVIANDKLEITNDIEKKLPQQQQQCSVTQIQENIELFQEKNKFFKVLGSNKQRVYFYSAPFDNCRTESFVISGDQVTGTQRYGNYTQSIFVNSKTGINTQGWLQNEHITKFDNSSIQPTQIPSPSAIQQTNLTLTPDQLIAAEHGNKARFLRDIVGKKVKVTGRVKNINDGFFNFEAAGSFSGWTVYIHDNNYLANLDTGKIVTINCRIEDMPLIGGVSKCD